MSWHVVVHHNVVKQVHKFPSGEIKKIESALDTFAVDPYAGISKRCGAKKMSGGEGSVLIVYSTNYL